MASKKDVQSLNIKLDAIQKHLNKVEVELQKNKKRLNSKLNNLLDEFENIKKIPLLLRIKVAVLQLSWVKIKFRVSVLLWVRVYFRFDSFAVNCLGQDVNSGPSFFLGLGLKSYTCLGQLLNSEPLFVLGLDRDNLSVKCLG